MYSLHIFKDVSQGFPDSSNHEVKFFKSKENAMKALEEEFEDAKKHFIECEAVIEKYDNYFQIKDDCDTVYVSIRDIVFEDDEE